MKIAFFELTNERFARSIQIDHAVDLLREGHRVTWFRNDSPLSLFGEFVFTNFVDHKFDLSNSAKILESLAKKYSNFEISYFNIPKLKSLVGEEEIGVELSQKAWQEVTVLLRDSVPCKTHNFKDFKNYASLLKNLNQTFTKMLAKGRWDRVVVYNGRFLREFALWQASEQLKIPIVFLERFNLDWNLRYFSFSEPVHSADYRAQVIKEYFQVLPLAYSEKAAIANNWLHKRTVSRGTSFTQLQDTDFKPSRDFKEIIAFFHSSEDELYSTGLDSVKWRNQFDAIDEIIELIKNCNDILFVVRVHPNLLAKSKREKVRWHKFISERSYSNVLFIPPESKIRSYDVLKKATKVLTFGSTIGIEATFFAKPSALLSSALHSQLNALTKINNSSELRLFIFKRPSESVEIPFGAIAYGFFLETAGVFISNLEILPETSDSQDPIFSYAGHALYHSKLLSALKRVEGILRKGTRHFKSLSCPLDHNPYMHNQVAG